MCLRGCNLLDLGSIGSPLVKKFASIYLRTLPSGVHRYGHHTVGDLLLSWSFARRSTYKADERGSCKC